MGYSLHSLKGGYIGVYIGFRLNSLKGVYVGDYVGDVKGDTRSLDRSSYCFVAFS